jgi:hypothetical protein
MYTPCSNEKAKSVKPYYPSGLPQFGLILAILIIVACGDNSPQDVVDGPCPGESGFGARLESEDGLVDVCVADDSVATFFTHLGWYDVTARMTAPDGTVYEFSMMFPHHTSSRKLNLTGDLTEAKADANGAWFRFIENPPEGPALESTAVAAGTFHLGYSDTDVVAGLFENVVLEMVVSGQAVSAGTQSVPEGFFSVLTDTRESAAR